MGRVKQFRYDISRPAWVMIGLLLAVVVLLWAQYIFLDLTGRDPGSPIGLLLIVIVVGVALIPVPAMEMMWRARGRVEVDATGLRWRGWGGWSERAWGEILAVGMPPDDARKQDDERIHVVTEEEYEFIHGFCLRNREELRDLLRTHGDLAESETVGRHTFHCRPGVGRLVAKRAGEHADLDADDGIDFLAGRFRPF